MQPTTATSTFVPGRISGLKITPHTAIPRGTQKSFAEAKRRKKNNANGATIMRKIVFCAQAG
jgi:hypothetical protein